MKTALDILGANFPTPTDDAAKRRNRVLAALAGGLLGMFGWKKHRVLGALGGLAVGRTVYGVATKDMSPTDAVEGLIPHAAAIGTSLLWKKHPAWGYIGGAAVAGTGVAVARGQSLTTAAKESVMIGVVPPKALIGK